MIVSHIKSISIKSKDTLDKLREPLNECIEVQKYSTDTNNIVLNIKFDKISQYGYGKFIGYLRDIEVSEKVIDIIRDAYFDSVEYIEIKQ